MFPLGFAFGAIAGAAAVAVLGPEVVHRSRPAAKAALKAALIALHEARVRKAQIAEAAEDLYAEARSEAAAEVLAAAMAAARAKAAGAARTSAETAKPGAAGAAAPDEDHG